MMLPLEVGKISSRTDEGVSEKFQECQAASMELVLVPEDEV